MQASFFVCACVCLLSLLFVPSVFGHSDATAATPARSAVEPAVRLSSQTPLTHLAFGSCNKHDRPQFIWGQLMNTTVTMTSDSAVAQQSQQTQPALPDLFLWLGDIIYGDVAYWEVLRFPSTPDFLAATYAKQKSLPVYQQFEQAMNQNPLYHNETRILGVYDDHDYGENNGNNYYPYKEEARQILFDFLNEPKDSLRRTRPHGGAYNAYIFGPPAARVKVILLDIRYFQNHTEKDILGEMQWQWLEDQLQDKQEDISLYIITSGIQIISMDKTVSEGWRVFPKSRARLLSLLSQSVYARQKSALLLTGDVHFAEFDSTYTCHYHPDQPALPAAVDHFVEVTSSGLTHSIGRGLRSPKLTEFIFSLLIDKREPHLPPYYADLNYASLYFDWNQKRVIDERTEVNDPVVSIHIKGEDGQTHRQISFPFSQLSRQPFSSIPREVQPFVLDRCAEEQLRATIPPFHFVLGNNLPFKILCLLLLLCCCFVSCITACRRNTSPKTYAHSKKSL